MFKAIGRGRITRRGVLVGVVLLSWFSGKWNFAFCK
jgi:hypothetical protein